MERTPCSSFYRRDDGKPRLQPVETFHPAHPHGDRQTPPVRERSAEERYRLITGFLKEEALRFGREISVSPDVIRALLH